MIRRVAISTALLSYFAERQKKLVDSMRLAHINEKEVAFMELEDNEYMEFNNNLLEVAPANNKSVVGVTINDGEVVASWYFDIEE